MHPYEFKKIIKTFSDSEDDFILEKNKLVINVNDNLIDVDISINSDGDLNIIESGEQFKAQTWIVQRLAKLNLLAHRILEKICEDIFFVEPHALSNIDEVDNEVETPNAVNYLISKINERSLLETNIIYLTSGAGEGKTSLINEAARMQAKRFINKESKWLLLPISLGGRPFLRFDDITIGALQNRYRFPHLYYESFIALVQLGLIVPAFDGFEEMFVETGTGEAVTAMGILVQALNSQGSLVIAARKAYFEFEDMQSSERMFNSINDHDVYFGKIEIQRWDKNKFIEYGHKRNIHAVESAYENISKIIGIEHPILTRAVLATKLIDVIESEQSTESFINNIRAAASDFFSVFVSNILAREATQKWIDRSGQGDVGLPLLSVEEHFALLSEISLTIWDSRTDFLKDDMLKFVVDYFCNMHKKSPTHIHQIAERIKTHALLAPSEDAHSAIRFDHEDFKNFFLGEAIYQKIKTTNASAQATSKSIFRRDILPATAKDALIRAILRNTTQNDLERYLDFMLSAAQSEVATSYTHINYANILISLLNEYEGKDLDISHISFGVDALKNIRIKNTHFTDCFFDVTGLDFSNIEKCHFDNCNFNQIKLHNKTIIVDTAFKNCNINELITADSEMGLWEPIAISNHFKSINVDFSINGIEDSENIDYSYTLSQELTNFKKILRYLKRSTRISESIIHMKLGNQGKCFMDDAIPLLIDHGVIEEIKHTGRGSKRQFKLLIPFSDINNFIDKAKGKFQDFLKYAQGKP